MSNSAISNSFVVTGIFNAETMIAQVNAAMAKIDTSLTASFSKIGTGLNATINTGTAGAVSNVKGIETALKNLDNGGKKVGGNLNNANKEMDLLNNGIFTAVKRVVLWGAASRLVFNSFAKINSTLEDSITLNKLLVDIQKIRPTGFKVDTIESNVIASAKEYGVAFEEIGETQRLFFQQGFKTNEVLALSKAQLLGVAASGLSATESMELLISAMSVFGREANQAVLILDKLQQVQANFAIGTQDIATAMRRVGPVVESVGGDLDNLIGVITALKTTTRKSGEFIGTALSTIFSRVFTPTGENALRNIGVYINESALAIRPLNDILDQVAVKWETLNNVEKKNLALALGARRRFPQVLALFDSYDIALKAAAESSESFGAATIAQEKELQSVSRQMAILTETSRAFGLSFAEAMSPSGDVDADMKRVIKTVIGFFDYLEAHKNTLATGFKWGASLIGFSLIIPAIKGVYLGFAGLQAVLISTSRSNLNFTKSLFGTSVAAGNATKQMATLIAATATTGKSTDLLTAKLYSASAGVASFDSVLKKSTLSAITLKAALSTMLPVIGTLIAIAGTIFVFDKIKTSMEDTIPVAKDMTDTFKGMGDASDYLKKSLEKYYSVSKQFRNVGGVTDLKQFNNVISELKASGKDLSKVSFGDFASSMESLGYEAGTAKEELTSLSTVIGYLKSVRGGAGRELEKLSENISAMSTELLEFSGVMSRIGDAGGSEGLQNLFSELFGTGYVKTEGKKLEKELQKILSTIYGLPGFDSKNETSIISSFIGQTDGLLKSLTKEYGQLGYIVSEAFVKELTKNLTKGAYSADIDFDVFDADSMSKSFADALKKATDTDVLDRALRENLIKSRIDLFDYLRDPNAEGAGKDLRDAILVFQNSAKGLQENISSEYLSKYTDDLLKLRAAMSVSTIGTVDLSKKMTKLYKDMLTYDKDTLSLASTMQVITQKAITYGQSLPVKQLSAYNKVIKQGLDVVSQIKTMDVLIKASKAREASLKAESAKITKNTELNAKANQQALDYTKAAINEHDSRVNLQHSMDSLLASNGKLNISLAISIAKAKTLTAIIRESKDAYNRGSDSVKLYKKDINNSIKVVESYIKSSLKLNKTLSDTKYSGDRAKLLKSELNLIQATTKAQTRSLNSKINASDKEYTAVKALIGLKKQTNEINLEDLATIQSYTGVTDALATKTDALLDKASRKHDIEVSGFNTQKDRLVLEKAQNESLARQRAYLSEIKSIQVDINSLASGYASAFTDVLRNVGDLVGKQGALRDVLEGFSDAYVNSIASSMEKGLTEAFKGISANTIGRDIEDLEKKIKDEQANQTNKGVYDSILNGYTAGGKVAYNYIIDAFRKGASSLNTISVTTGVDTGAGIVDINTTGIDKALRDVEGILYSFSLDTSKQEAVLAKTVSELTARLEKITEIKDIKKEEPVKVTPEVTAKFQMAFADKQLNSFGNNLKNVTTQTAYNFNTMFDSISRNISGLGINFDPKMINTGELNTELGVFGTVISNSGSTFESNMLTFGNSIDNVISKFSVISSIEKIDTNYLNDRIQVAGDGISLHNKNIQDALSGTYTKLIGLNTEFSRVKSPEVITNNSLGNSLTTAGSSVLSSSKLMQSSLSDAALSLIKFSSQADKIVMPTDIDTSGITGSLSKTATNINNIIIPTEIDTSGITSSLTNVSNELDVVSSPLVNNLLEVARDIQIVSSNIRSIEMPTLGEGISPNAFALNDNLTTLNGSFSSFTNRILQVSKSVGKVTNAINTSADVAPVDTESLNTSLATVGINVESVMSEFLNSLSTLSTGVYTTATNLDSIVLPVQSTPSNVIKQEIELPTINTSAVNQSLDLMNSNIGLSAIQTAVLLGIMGVGFENATTKINNFSNIDPINTSNIEKQLVDAANIVSNGSSSSVLSINAMVSDFENTVSSLDLNPDPAVLNTTGAESSLKGLEVAVTSITPSIVNSLNSVILSMEGMTTNLLPLQGTDAFGFQNILNSTETFGTRLSISSQSFQESFASMSASIEASKLSFNNYDPFSTISFSDIKAPTSSVDVNQTNSINNLSERMSSFGNSLNNFSSAQQDSASKVVQADLKAAKMTQFLNSTMQMVGNSLGQLIGGGGQGANLGAGVGGSFGSIWGPAGGAAGSILGGFFGGFFDKDEEKDPVIVDPIVARASTDAIMENTRALLQNSQSFDFMKRLINAPSNYIDPATASLGGGYPAVTVNINAPVGNEDAVASAVGNAIAKVYKSDERRIGRR